MIKIIAGNLTLASNLEHQPLIFNFVIFDSQISKLLAMVIYNENAYSTYLHAMFT